MEPQVAVETSWTCSSCGATRLVPALLVVSLQRDDLWSSLGDLLVTSCGACGHRGITAPVTVLLEAEGDEDRPGYLLLPARGTPPSADIEEGRRFLRESNVSPELVAGVVPAGWPAADADLDAGVLSTLEADPGIASEITRYMRRRKVVTALMELGGVTSPRQIRQILRACPELATDGLDAERELLSILEWPPEGARLAGALAELLRVLTPSVTDAELEAAYKAFNRECRAGIKQILKAGHRKARWLVRHLGAPAEEWDTVAADALHLLGLGNDEPGRAELLFHVGAHVVGRSDATQDKVAWGIRCLHESRELWLQLGDDDGVAAASDRVAMALYAWDYGDAYASACEAEALMREVVAYYGRTQRTRLYAMAMTNLATILLKAAAFDERRDRIQEAVDLCRSALPLRPKAKDPNDWAFSAANLALALTRLGSDDAATRRHHLEEAAAVSQEAAAIFDAQGNVLVGDQARVNRLDALFGVFRELREERFRVVVEGDETDQESHAQLAGLLDSNPAIFGLTDTPPEIAEIVNGPAAPEEAQILETVLNEAAAMLEEPRMRRSPSVRSGFARITAMVWPMLLGPTQDAVDAMASARRLIDETVAPAAAAETASELGNLLAHLGRWPEAAAAFDDCLAIHDRMLQYNWSRDRIVQTLAQNPNLARWTAYAHVRSGDPQTAVTVLERTRSRSLPRLVPGAGRSLELLSWRSATLNDIGGSATPTCPVAYVLTAPAGSAVLLVRRDDNGHVAVRAYESSLSSGFFIAKMFPFTQLEHGFLSAQMIADTMGPAVQSLMQPLGSLLEPVATELLADDVQDLILIPTGPAALLPWAAATVTRRTDSQPTLASELLNISIAPSAASVVLGRERAAGRAYDATKGRLLVVADPERQDIGRLPGARVEARMIEGSFPGRVDLLAGPAARTDGLLSQLPACWVAHLACHGTNDALEPEAMRLLLSDGDVTLDQLLQLPQLRARLVVLSACQTGHVDIVRAPDEMLGMPLAFLNAGACTVVSTLWRIDDRVTAILIGRLYEELATEIGADGRGDVAAALARSQRWLRNLTAEQARRWCEERGIDELPAPARSITAVPSPVSPTDPQYADPHYWAGFVAYGR